ncbi:MAG TPA: hypothetical protein VER96_14735 [Polyangiaceae bacterium]|nr:hypothetical protein [Polyangiaceae bacterium]
MTTGKLELEPCSLGDFGRLEYDFAKALLSDSGHPLLVIRLSGSGSNAAHECGVFDLAPGIIMLGLEVWQPSALVLDLTNFKYEWGDMMRNVLSAGQRWYGTVHPFRAVFCAGLPERLPFAVLVSDLNREGLTSLVEDEMGGEVASTLYESFSDAASALDRQLLGVPLI